MTKLVRALPLVLCLWGSLCSDGVGNAEGRYVPPQRDVVHAIILEAAGEGREGMYAVACVFRNRLDAGMSLGSVGLFRRDRLAFVAQQPRYARADASFVYNRVFVNFGPDSTGGATHFESTDFAQPDWLSRGKWVITKVIGKHVFYKQVGR